MKGVGVRGTRAGKEIRMAAGGANGKGKGGGKGVDQLVALGARSVAAARSAEHFARMTATTVGV